MDSNKNDTKELMYKTERNSDFKAKLMVTIGGAIVGREESEGWE